MIVSPARHRAGSGRGLRAASQTVAKGGSRADAEPLDQPRAQRTQWRHHIPAVTKERWPMTFRTLRLTVRVHARARTERLEWDGSTLQLWVREPPANGRANAAVIRAVARWAGVAPSQVAIVSGTTARHKLVEIECEDGLPPPAV